MRNLEEEDGEFVPGDPRIDSDPDGIRICAFDELSAAAFGGSIRNAIRNKQPLYVIEIDAYGGQAYSLFGMIDILERAKKVMTVATFCSGKAMSSAALFLAAGTHGCRFMSEHSTVMIHKVSGGHCGKLDELKANFKETERLNRLAVNVLSKYTNKSVEEVNGLMDSKDGADVYLNAKEAKSWGFIDKIGVPIHIQQVGHALTI